MPCMVVTLMSTIAVHIVHDHVNYIMCDHDFKLLSPIVIIMHT